MTTSKAPGQRQSAADVARIMADNMRENQKDPDFLVREARRREAAAEKVMGDETGPPPDDLAQLSDVELQRRIDQMNVVINGMAANNSGLDAKTGALALALQAEQLRRQTKTGDG